MTRKLSFASVLTALTIVCLYGSTILPTGKIALLALTSLCVLVTQAECGTRYALIQYAASALIGLLLVPTKFQSILFIAFIGYYPIVKSHIERLDKLWLEWIVKIFYFNAMLICLYFIVKYFLLRYVSFGPIFDYVLSHLVIVVAILELVFVFYDYLLSLMASYYNNVIKKKMQNF